MGRMARILTMTVLAITLLGCALGEILADYGDPVELTEEQLVGVWRSGDTDHLLEFRADGTFTANGLPYDEFDFAVPDTFDPRTPLDGSGTWRLSGAKVVLEFEVLGGAESRMADYEVDVRKFDDTPILLIIWYVGDGGNEWTSWAKCAESCPSARPVPSPTVSRSWPVPRPS